ncbi:hypothetical protein HNR68_002910 [Saccharopolyspora hordei]|uniref:Uncharacterized protein n=1 Tax=Saccharopolyspora hordei TaxID=1838 RepID=A0A853ARR1_9PSEU|nr:hypothetical protein [Saccharopolyspora hordei]
MDVVVDGEAVLGEEAQDGEQLLGDVGDRDDQQRPGDVDAPGVVPLHGGLFRRQVQPCGREPAQPLPVPLDHQLGRDLLDGRVHQCSGVTGGEGVHARVVGAEQFGGVHSRGGGEGVAGGRAGAVRHVGRVARVPGDRVVPPRGPADGAQHEHPLQLAERVRFVRRAVGQWPVRDLVAQGEAA